MKRILTVNMIFVLLALCGCTDLQENKDTRFLLNTFVTLTADCDDETMAEAFSLCENYERKFSRTIESSEVSRLNRSTGFFPVSSDTAKLVKRAVFFGDLSGGMFDITICPVSSLWNFNGHRIPDRGEIASALQNVDYHSIEISGNSVNLNGKQIDLGGIAKGDIADRLSEFFRKKGVKNAIINLGGNLVTVGKTITVGIQKPFAPKDEFSAKLRVKNKSVVTSGTYERYVEQDGKIFHHILDPHTGFGVQTDLSSATVIGESSCDGDALATVCILLGQKKAMELIENTAKTEAIFISSDGRLTATSGLKEKNGTYFLKDPET